MNKSSDALMRSGHFEGLQQRLHRYRTEVRGNKGLVGNMDDADKLVGWAKEVIDDMQKRNLFQPSNIDFYNRSAKAIFVHQCLTEAVDIVVAETGRELKKAEQNDGSVEDVLTVPILKIRAIMGMAAGTEKPVRGKRRTGPLWLLAQNGKNQDGKAGGESSRYTTPYKFKQNTTEGECRSGCVVQNGLTVLGYVSRHRILENEQIAQAYRANFPAAENYAVCGFMRLIAITNTPNNAIMLAAAHAYGKACTKNTEIAASLMRWRKGQIDVKEGGEVEKEIDRVLAGIADLQSELEIKSIAGIKPHAEEKATAQGTAKAKKDEPKPVIKSVSILHPSTVENHQRLWAEALSHKLTGVKRPPLKAVVPVAATRKAVPAAAVAASVPAVKAVPILPPPSPTRQRATPIRASENEFSDPTVTVRVVTVPANIAAIGSEPVVYATPGMPDGLVPMSKVDSRPLPPPMNARISDVAARVAAKAKTREAELVA
ncbi:MAG: hypothetical protein EYC62_02260 [Alphaproteobacteria bacterium]|nr:MAG: hypothetical protein EYC62_02260 [Alphaproteobacteria bacterium]